MKKILLTQRIVKERKSFRDASEKDLINFLLNLNCISYLVPNSYIKNHKKLNLWLSNINIDALVLSGGNDLGEYKERDDLEKYLIQHCIKKSIPILGICRGAQIIGKFFKNKIVKVENHVGFHRVKTFKNFLNNKLVNSFHNYGIKKLKKDFEIIAECNKDQSIEAFVHKQKKILGIMWHPERFKKRRKDQERFIKNFLFKK